MTLLFMDSFDHYDIGDILKKWTSGYGITISAGNGRNGTDALFLGGSGGREVLKTLSSSHTTLIVGFAVKFAAFTPFSSTFFYLIDMATEQVSLDINADGTISVKRGGAVLATSSESFQIDAWYFLEFKVLINNGAGTIDLRVNEISWISEVAQDTQQTANNSVNVIKFRGGTSVVSSYIDDLYVMNNSGAVNNDFIGDYRVEALLPNGAGNAAQWDRFPDTGEVNYEDVDENPADDDTTYTHQDGAGLPQLDTHLMDNLVTTAGLVAGVQTLLDARKDDAGAVTCQPVFRQGGADHVQSNFNLGDNYLYHQEIVESDPDTAAPWTIAGINSVEFGYRRSA
ncbi:hypothetical protein LCGC14_0466540 [marine sediment metagenome]|uniref:Uncharacterized protein n=1 Tax=marine sediment metagenome TaxID=412755 RepID=A0A0F9SIT6_9ZZZZ